MAERWPMMCPQREHLVTGTSYNAQVWLECRWSQIKFFPQFSTWSVAFAWNLQQLFDHLWKLFLKAMIIFLCQLKYPQEVCLCFTHQSFLYPSGEASTNCWTAKLALSDVRCSVDTLLLLFTYFPDLMWYLLVLQVFYTDVTSDSPFWRKKKKRFAEVPCKKKKKEKGRHSKNENLRPDNLCGNSPLSHSLLYEINNFMASLFFRIMKPWNF